MRNIQPTRTNASTPIITSAEEFSSEQNSSDSEELRRTVTASVEILRAQNNVVVLCDEQGGKRLRSKRLADEVIRRMRRAVGTRANASTPISRYPAQAPPYNSII